MALPSGIKNVGVGLRSPHVNEILSTKPDLQWLEMLADNHLQEGGLARQQLFALRDHYPMTMHGVNLSLGGLDPLDWVYADKLKKLYKELEVSWFSEHLCFSHGEGLYSHDLLPLPYTDEAVRHCAQRIDQFQDFWGEKILIENVSSYVSCDSAPMNEAEFVCAVLGEVNCDLLLDINNLYVNQVNHGESARGFIDGLPVDRVKEIHLAGFEDRGEFLLDAHNNPVSNQVWGLYEYALNKGVAAATLIEWDNQIPDLTRLLEERDKAQQRLSHAQREAA